jgi:hypothetical protein
LSRKLLRFWIVLALVILPSGSLNASTKVTVTAPEGFADGIVRVALVAAECAPELDCPSVLARLASTMKGELKLPLKIVDDSAVRGALFKKGATEYSESHRAELAEALALDAIFEIRIPFANRGDGFGGRQGSESKVELRLVKPSGEILMSGTGFGRPMNVVTSPERVADRTLKEILEKAFEKKSR